VCLQAHSTSALEVRVSADQKQHKTCHTLSQQVMF